MGDIFFHEIAAGSMAGFEIDKCKPAFPGSSLRLL
jgi:hypothetical protein